MPDKCLTELDVMLKEAGMSDDTVSEATAALDARSAELNTMTPEAKSKMYRSILAESKFIAEQKRVRALYDAEIDVKRANGLVELIDSGQKADYMISDMVDGNLTTRIGGAANGYTNMQRSLEDRKVQSLAQDLVDAAGTDANGDSNFIYWDMFQRYLKAPDEETSYAYVRELAYANNKLVAELNGTEYTGPAPGSTGNKFAEILAGSVVNQQMQHNNLMKIKGQGITPIENYIMPQKHFSDLMQPSGPAQFVAWARGYTARDGKLYRGRDAITMLKSDAKAEWKAYTAERLDLEKTITAARKVAYAEQSGNIRKLTRFGFKVSEADATLGKAVRDAIYSGNASETMGLIDKMFPNFVSEKNVAKKFATIAEKGTDTEKDIVKRLKANPELLSEAKKMVIRKDPTVSIDTLLDDIYEGITNPFNKLGMFSELGHSHSKRLEMGRILHYKDADAWLQYQTKYGHNNVFQNTIYTLRKHAKDEAYASVFGNNSKERFAHIQELAGEHYKTVRRNAEARGDLQEAARASKAIQDISRLTNKLEIYSAYVEGVFDVQSNSSFNRIIRGLMNFSKLRLGQSLLPAVADANRKLAALEKVMRIHPLEYTPFVAIGRVFNYFKAPLVRRYFNDRRALVHSFIGSSTGHVNRLAPGGMSEISNAGGDAYYKARQFVRKGIDAYMAFTMSNQFDEASKSGVADVLGTYLGNVAAKGAKWEDLGQGMREHLHMADIGEAEWEVYKKRGIYKYGKEQENWAMSAWQLDKNITNQDIADYLGVPLNELTDMDLLRAKSELVSKYDQFITTFANTAVITPNMETRVALQGDSNVDSPMRAIRMMFTEFLSYPTRVVFDLHRGIMSDFSVNGASLNTNLQRIAKIAALNYLYGYFALSAKDLVNGRKPRDPFNANTALESLMMGGALGIIGETALRIAQQRSLHELDRWLGPSGTWILDTGDLAISFMKGDAKAKKTVDYLYRQIPNLLWTKYAFDKYLTPELYKLFGEYYDIEERNLKIEEEFGTYENFIDMFTR